MSSSRFLPCLGDRFEYAFYRTQDGAECDLVITEKLAPVVSLEIKFTAAPTLTKGLRQAFQDVAAAHNYIIIPECREPYLAAENGV